MSLYEPEQNQSTRAEVSYMLMCAVDDAFRSTHNKHTLLEADLQDTCLAGISNNKLAHIDDIESQF